MCVLEPMLECPQKDCMGRGLRIRPWDGTPGSAKALLLACEVTLPELVFIWALKKLRELCAWGSQRPKSTKL
jgi:hypothetical protein